MNHLEDIPTLFTLNHVPVKARRDFWLMPPLLTGSLAWLVGKRQPDYPFRRRLLVGFLGAPLAFVADLGHALAHTVSARLAGGPMDAIRLSAGMPRTYYTKNDVLPRVHILRSIGGPLFNLVGFLLSLLWRRTAQAGSLSQDLSEISAASHGALTFASLLPLPIIDGGVILKWSLVRRGHPPAQAGQLVNRTSIGLGTTALAAAALLFTLGHRTLGALLAIGGAIATATGLEWLQ